MFYRRNADRGGRDLERAAAAGDPRAQEALARHRLKTGELAAAARVLIASSSVLGLLPHKLARKLVVELVRADELRYYAALEEWARGDGDTANTLGSYLTRGSAERACAEGILERAEWQEHDAAPRWRALYEAGRHGRVITEWNEGPGRDFEEPTFYVASRDLEL